MPHPLLKTLISEMVESYLEESYEDDLVESIFEEVSEETWEAIEEAILSELSPSLLNRYINKADKKADSATSRTIKSFNSDGNMATISRRLDTRRAAQKEYKKRKSGIAKATDSMNRKKDDLENLHHDDFKKKYNMAKPEYEKKYKRALNSKNV